MSEAIDSAPKGAPSPDEIRAALDHMLFSEVFATLAAARRLSAFVVEAALHGKGNRSRATPSASRCCAATPSSIRRSIRSSASRRRGCAARSSAITRVRASDDSVIIDLPRGSYVPTFRRRESAKPAAPLIGEVGQWPKSLLQMPMPAVLAAMVIAVAAAIIGGLYLGRQATTTPGTVVVGEGEARHGAALPPGNGMPVVLIEPIRVIGTPPPSHPVAAERLRAKIGDAFARFDTINVASGPALASKGAAVTAPPAPHSDYVLSGTLEYTEDAANAWFTLTSVAEGKLAWSRTFEQIHPPVGAGLTEDTVVIALTNSLLQSYGVIRSRDRANQLASNVGDPRYRCVLEAADSMHKSDRQLHNTARACLENLTAADPSFALGFTFLAMLYNREFQLAYDLRSEDPPLERALRAARQGILLNPESSRGYLALMVVQSNRRDIRGRSRSRPQDGLAQQVRHAGARRIRRPADHGGRDRTGHDDVAQGRRQATQSARHGTTSICLSAAI